MFDRKKTDNNLFFGGGGGVIYILCLIETFLVHARNLCLTGKKMIIIFLGVTYFYVYLPII